MTRILTVTSARTGAGKTGIITNLATRLAQRGQRVCVLDLGHGADSLAAGLATGTAVSLEDIAPGKSRNQQLVNHTDAGYDLIAGGGDTEVVTRLDASHWQCLAECFNDLSGYDLVLVDLPGDDNPAWRAFALASDEIILLLTPDAESLTASYTCLKTLQGAGYEGSFSVLVNRCVQDASAMEEFDKFQRVSSFYLGYQLPLLGVIHEQTGSSGLIDGDVPLVLSHPEGNGVRDFDALAATLQEGLAGEDGCSLSEYIKNVHHIIEIDNNIADVIEPVFGGKEVAGEVDSQIESLAGQVDRLLSEISRLRQDQPQDLCRWIEQRYLADGVASEVEVAEHALYELRQNNGNSLRFACHGPDEDAQPDESRSSLS